uniref:MOB kinase activator 3A n=1 Tax=Catharus ustulatus TaxID=91951 RepID=A0A8C3UUK1_CATUS
MSHALKQVFNKDKTFRPKRKFEPGTQRFELHKKAQASLNAGLDLKVAVQLPPGEEQNDWVAHFYYFVKEFNLIDTKELEPLVSVWAQQCHPMPRNGTDS